MKTRRWFQSAALLGSFAALLQAEQAFAHAPDSYGFGPRGAAMGSAVAADSTDFSANYYNPAGIVGSRNVSLSLAYFGADNQLTMNGKDNNVLDPHGLLGGLVVPGKLFGIPFAFGIATYIPDDGLSRIKALRQETPRWELYNDRASIVFIAANLAVRVFDIVEIGGGVAFLATTRGEFGIRGEAILARPYESKLEHEVNADLTSLRYPQVGARVKVKDLGFVGLVYRGETKLELSIGARLQGTVNAGLSVPLTYLLESKTFDGFLPQQVALGLTFQKIRNLKVNFDLTWVNWSRYVSPTAQTSTSLDVVLPPGLGIELPGDTKPTKVIPPQFEDRFVPRVGIEYTFGFGRRKKVYGEEKPAVQIPLRAGYVYEQTPVPDQNGVTNFVDSDRHTFSVGSALVLNQPFSALRGTLHLDAYFQASVLPERRVLKANAADFTSDYVAQGTMLGGGVGVGVDF
ncbi:MAG: outer membrane protein transport protein [Polyangiaceae bacterium]|nr:outer membrane protein transport protein [Polyangiaceae bacterium]